MLKHNIIKYHPVSTVNYNIISISMFRASAGTEEDRVFKHFRNLRLDDSVVPDLLNPSVVEESFGNEYYFRVFACVLLRPLTAVYYDDSENINFFRLSLCTHVPRPTTYYILIRYDCASDFMLLSRKRVQKTSRHFYRFTPWSKSMLYGINVTPN